MQVAAKVRIAPAMLSVGGAELRGSSAQGVSIPATALTVNGDMVELPLTPSNHALPNSIQFHNGQGSGAFTIDWEIKIGTSGWSPLGSTKHTVYVTRDAPISAAQGLMRETLFNIGCRNAQGLGDDEAAVVNAIYNEFTDRSVQRVTKSTGNLDGVDMQYWGILAGGVTSTAGLLSTSDGQCGAWARFYVDVLRAQGIDSQLTIIEPPAASLQGMTRAINNHFGGVTSINSFNPCFFVKHWDLTNADTFDIVDIEGLAAQGNTNPHAIFNDHAVVIYDSHIYDPSYGSTPFHNENDWENASVDAYGATALITYPLGILAVRWVSELNDTDTVDTSFNSISY